MRDDPEERQPDVTRFIDDIGVVRREDLVGTRAENVTPGHHDTGPTAGPVPLSDHYGWVMSRIRFVWICYTISAFFILLLAFADWRGFMTKFLYEHIFHERMFFHFFMNILLCFAGIWICFTTFQAAQDIRDMRKFDSCLQVGVGASLWIGLHLTVTFTGLLSGEAFTIGDLTVIFAFVFQVVGFIILGRTDSHIRRRFSELHSRKF